MGKLQNLEIVFDQPQGVYQSGQVVTGQVVVELSEQMKMRAITVRLCGAGSVHWAQRVSTGTGDKRRTRTVHHRDAETYCDLTATVFGGAEQKDGQDPQHPKGRSAYPFQLQLPEKIPSSFEGAFGYVRYVARASIVKPWKFDHRSIKALTVLSALDLNTQPDAREAQQSQKSKTLCCLCCKSGPISARFRIDRKGYVPGEFLMVNGEVDNKSSRKMASSCIQLKMYTVFRAHGHSKVSSNLVTELQKGEVLPGDTEAWTGEILYIPPLPPTALEHCKMIDVRYIVSLKVSPAGPALALEVPLEVCVGTIPLENIAAKYAASAFITPDVELDMSGDDVEQPALTAPPSMPSEQDLYSDKGQPPPPSYAACIFGKVKIQQEEDNEYTRGTTTFSPSYAYYTWDQPAEQQRQTASNDKASKDNSKGKQQQQQQQKQPRPLPAKGSQAVMPPIRSKQGSAKDRSK